jgi:hypothetical protein
MKFLRKSDGKLFAFSLKEYWAEGQIVEKLQVPLL